MIFQMYYSSVQIHEIYNPMYIFDCSYVLKMYSNKYWIELIINHELTGIDPILDFEEKKSLFSNQGKVDSFWLTHYFSIGNPLLHTADKDLWNFHRTHFLCHSRFGSHQSWGVGCSFWAVLLSLWALEVSQTVLHLCHFCWHNQNSQKWHFVFPCNHNSGTKHLGFGHNPHD